MMILITSLDEKKDYLLVQIVFSELLKSGTPALRGISRKFIF